MKLELLRKLERDRAEMRAVVLVTHLNSGQQYLVYPLEKEAENSIEESILEAAKGAMRSDKGGTIPAPDDDGEVFLNVYNPPLRMIIVGAVHIAQPLSQIAAHQRRFPWVPGSGCPLGPWSCLQGKSPQGHPLGAPRDHGCPRAALSALTRSGRW